MSTTVENRLKENLTRDLFTFEDERNPGSSQINRIWPPTILDQVFDHLSPTRKNLRQIIADLRQEIITGGIGNIVFPVTHVNGKTGGEIWLYPVDIGLGRVDNTSDMDKPLSVPQRTAIMEILKTYNFNVNNINFANLEKLMAHLTDFNNPHNVSIDDLNLEEVTALVNRLVQSHNINASTATHPDIRRSLTILWNRVDDIDGNIESRIESTLNTLDAHFIDGLAHDNLFKLKEDIINRVSNFDSDDNDHSHYPTTRAVFDHVTHRFNTWQKQFPSFTITEWITNQEVQNGRTDLPPASEQMFRRSYLLRRSGSLGIEMSLAVCRKNTDGDYWWDIQPAGGISLFDPKYFIPKSIGMSINLPTLLSEIYNDGMLNDFYNREAADERFVRAIEIVPGNMDGTIRYFINDDTSTMSDNIPVAGLQSLAFKQWVTEHDIRDLAVHNRHMLSRSVDARVLKEQAIDREHLNPDLIKMFESLDALGYCKKDHILGNLFYEDGQIHNVNLTQLADKLRPLIGGWPDIIADPSGGPDFNVTEIIDYLARMANPEFMTPGVEYPNPDGSKLIRFVGKISRIPNQTDVKQLSTDINSDLYHLVDTKGSWCYQSDIRGEATLGGTNHTGHTYAWVTMKNTGLVFESLSIGDRVDAFYDVTVQYRLRK